MTEAEWSVEDFCVKVSRTKALDNEKNLVDDDDDDDVDSTQLNQLERKDSIDVILCGYWVKDLLERKKERERMLLLLLLRVFVCQKSSAPGYYVAKLRVERKERGSNEEVGVFFPKRRNGWKKFSRLFCLR